MTLLGHGAPVIDQIVMVPFGQQMGAKAFLRPLLLSTVATKKVGRVAAHSSSHKSVATTFLR